MCVRAFSRKQDGAIIVAKARNQRSNGDAEGTSVTFVISVAAELAGMHPQTLRQYDRLGLVVPARTSGRGRRYTQRDVRILREIQRLSQEEGINLAGIQRILELERRVEHLIAERDLLRSQLDEVEARRDRVFAASPDGEVRPMKRGQRSQTEASSSLGLRVRRGEEGNAHAITVWNPYASLASRRIRAVIEAGPSGVHIIEGSVTSV